MAVGKYAYKQSQLKSLKLSSFVFISFDRVLVVRHDFKININKMNHGNKKGKLFRKYVATQDKAMKKSRRILVGLIR